MLVCMAAFAQTASNSQLPDAPQQQPQAQPPPPPPEEAPKPEKNPESKVKRTLKRGAPNCIQIIGMEKCKQSSGDAENSSDEEAPPQPRVPANQPLPRSTNPNESSSKDAPADLAPAPGEGAPSDVQELHPYNPHRADKDVEVGDFYFKRGNYRAAESRYSGALQYMPNHAAAIFKLAETQERLGEKDKAQDNYRKYLKILPHGEFAEKANKALARLDGQAVTSPRAENRR